MNPLVQQLQVLISGNPARHENPNEPTHEWVEQEFAEVPISKIIAAEGR
jgi:hypothetical protein